ncbi:sushi domain-containing protein 6 isoform X2 [Phyllopteryx taeniolatus]|uniref:sushi domain-containing protein 6 isoform X2 n=1 Tax=Phyllopteryx taeniolatus TaxID=161469 RepID=UPI002AD4B9BB|nr:sushi domain-containing protein 6 isoform X2 [Phyllopteryx taeniolatus]
MFALTADPGTAAGGQRSQEAVKPRPLVIAEQRAAVVGLVFIASLLPPGRLSNCTHPLVPEHGGFRCEPSPCRGFLHKTSVHLFCEDGYRAPKSPVSWCHHGAWKPPIPTCLRIKGGAGINANTGADFAMPNMATTAVGVSIFLLTTTACLVVKSRLCPCQSHRRRSSDQLDLMNEGLPVSLPSYEEAVYGSWGQPLPPCRSTPPGPTHLLLAREPPGDQSCSENPPPPYEEVQSRRNDNRRLRVSLLDDKAV